MADFMWIQYENQRFKQSEFANQLGYSSSTLQRYRNDINLLSPYRIQSNVTNKRTKKASNTDFSNFNTNSRCEHDIKRPQLTSNDLVKPKTNTQSNKGYKKLDPCMKFFNLTNTI